MTREEHLKFCKRCLNRKFDLNQGIICNLTQKIADFESECLNFQIDESVKEPESRVEENAIDPSNLKNQTDDRIIQKLRSHQDFYYGFFGGLLATLVSSFIWAIITVATQYQIGYMAIGVGLLVGFTVQFFGAGIDKKFGYLGAALSLLGCMLGNLFSQVGFIANEQSLGYFETLTYLNFSLIINILIESFSPMDLIFYGIAVYEGYRFAFRKITIELLTKLKSGEHKGYPTNHKLRMPLAVSCIVILSIFFFILKQGVNRYKTYYFENGKIMSEGELKNSKEHGKWTYYYENGQVQSVGYYQKGNPDSLWNWYDESGNLTKSGNYKNGIEDGIWIGYYENSQMSDSGRYESSRMNGLWKYWHERGAIYQTGYFYRNLQDSIWSTYYENGQLKTIGKMNMGEPVGNWVDYHENGQIAKESFIDDDKKQRINNVWDEDGKQSIRDGNGILKSYADNGQLIEIGTLKSGLRKGLWKSYYNNGKPKEEIEYVNNFAEIKNYWDINGEQMVVNGKGTVTSYYPDNKFILETGDVIGGRREGIWKMFYQSSKNIYQENQYKKGELTGMQTVFYESGQLYTRGEMVNGLREGKWEWYYESGNISSAVNFKNDKKYGKQSIWSENGKLTKEEYYENGEVINEIYK